ncbi:MAG: T9SS type A sorting domain-containing protein [Bacteroidetes bacterium]|nr:T9SS type A sorting domain-containing protein [Bacteroidota bacterium]
MFRKLFLLLVLFSMSAVSFGNSIYTKEQIDELSRVQSKIILNGDAIKGEYVSGAPRIAVNKNGMTQSYFTDNATATFYRLTDVRNYYDIQSNGTAMQIWQDPNNLDNIHAVYMLSSDPGTTWPDRAMQYYFSSDRGTTWTYVSRVPSTGRAGYGMVTGLPSGAAIIALHGGFGASTNVRTQILVDAFTGLGSFAILDAGGVANKYSWPRLVLTQSSSPVNKFVFCASSLSLAGQPEDSAFMNIGRSFTSPDFTGYKLINSSQAETYALARAADGRIGLAYIVDRNRFPSDYGSVFFTESTDNGNTFSAATKIFSANFGTDSLGGLRGISLLYQGNTPKVVFETIKQTTAGNYFGGAPNNIRFWSTSLPGADPNRSIIIADSNNVPYAPMVGSNDVEGPVCRPSIGQASDGSDLYVAFMVQNEAVGGTDSSSYTDIYLTVSGNNGASWKRPFIITPTSPRMDWAYVTVSPINDKTANTDYINMICQRDTIPGANVNTPNTDTYADPFYIRVSYPAPVGINPVSSIADKFELKQNYPNPFNPVTNIRFSLPKLANVTLKVYGVDGKEVATLINDEIVSEGTKEVSFNATTLASGVYFYTITAGDFRETKKMMLLK